MIGSGSASLARPRRSLSQLNRASHLKLHCVIAPPAHVHKSIKGHSLLLKSNQH